MTPPAFRFDRLLIHLGLALLVLAGLGACSGAVSGPPTVNDPDRITILPGTAVAYSGLPITFAISGGTGAYIVSSSNQSIIPVSGPINGTSLTVVPNYVLANTTVTLTVRDTGTAPVASATVTVQPGTVNNDVTVTPTSLQTAACTPAMCSGGDALVSTTISQGGIPLAARGVRFDVVSGTFSFVQTDPVTLAVTLVNTIQVTTDETGRAIARIRIPANAVNQTALVQVTDVGTGTFQQTSFTIVQSTGPSPGFAVFPASVILQGVLLNQCAGNATAVDATFTIVGGVPPYNVSGGGSAFQVGPSVVNSSGGTFTATANGVCSPAPGTTLVVIDASGHTANANIQNIPGTASVPALSVSPSSVTLTSCSGTASANVSGGVGTGYFVASGSDALHVAIAGGTVSISRQNPSAAVAGPLSVGVSDGASVSTITVNLTGQGAGSCPALTAFPSSVPLTNCTTPATVTLSGGPGTYAAASNSASVSASVAASTLTIQRVTGSGAFVPPSTVTIMNGTQQGSVQVNATGAGAGSC